MDDIDVVEKRRRRGFRKTSHEAILSRARGQSWGAISGPLVNFEGPRFHFGGSKVVGSGLPGERG